MSALYYYSSYRQALGFFIDASKAHGHIKHKGTKLQFSIFFTLTTWNWHYTFTLAQHNTQVGN